MTTTATNLALLWQQTGGFYRLFCLSGARCTSHDTERNQRKITAIGKGLR